MATRSVLAVAAVLVAASTASGVEPSVRRLAKSSDSGDRRKAAKALAAEGSTTAVKLLRTLIRDDHA